jgi:hypothetical protein
MEVYLNAGIADSSLERNEFKLPVPRENGYRSEPSDFVYLTETVRVSSKDPPTSATEVRIHFPPAESPANFRIARVERRIIFLIAV